MSDGKIAALGDTERIEATVLVNSSPNSQAETSIPKEDLTPTFDLHDKPTGRLLTSDEDLERLSVLRSRLKELIADSHREGLIGSGEVLRVSLD